jgi:hypothetical protein
MTSIREQKKPVTAEAIARRADKGQSLTTFYSN